VYGLWEAWQTVKAELAQLSHNIDYTAALEEELMDFFGTGPLNLMSNIRLSELATRLNAALQKQHCVEKQLIALNAKVEKFTSTNTTGNKILAKPPKPQGEITPWHHCECGAKECTTYCNSCGGYLD